MCPEKSTWDGNPKKSWWHLLHSQCSVWSCVNRWVHDSFDLDAFLKADTWNFWPESHVSNDPFELVCSLWRIYNQFTNCLAENSLATVHWVHNVIQCYSDKGPTRKLHNTEVPITNNNNPCLQKFYQLHQHNICKHS